MLLPRPQSSSTHYNNLSAIPSFLFHPSNLNTWNHVHWLKAVVMPRLMADISADFPLEYIKCSLLFFFGWNITGFQCSIMTINKQTNMNMYLGKSFWTLSIWRKTEWRHKCLSTPHHISTLTAETGISVHDWGNLFISCCLLFEEYLFKESLASIYLFIMHFLLYICYYCTIALLFTITQYWESHLQFQQWVWRLIKVACVKGKLI